MKLDESQVNEMEAKLADRPDLIERLHKGDSSAFAEIMEYLTGAHAGEISYRLLA